VPNQTLVKKEPGEQQARENTKEGQYFRGEEPRRISEGCLKKDLRKRDAFRGAMKYWEVSRCKGIKVQESFRSQIVEGRVCAMGGERTSKRSSSIVCQDGKER